MLAAFIASAGDIEAAAGILIQQELDLWPPEVLDVRVNDVSLPEHLVGARVDCKATIGLGTRTRTEAKRAQAVVLRDGRLLGVLRFLVHRATLARRERFSPLSY